MGLVFGAFTLAYAACEIPSGFLGDRSGPEGVMTRIALWWSLFMALTSRAVGFLTLYASQLLFGAGAAGCYPSIARSFANSLCRSERARAQGMIWLGARWAGASTLFIMADLLFQFAGLAGGVCYAERNWSGLGARRSGDVFPKSPKPEPVQRDCIRRSHGLCF